MLYRKANVYHKQQETLKLLFISSTIMEFFVVCLANQNSSNTAMKINIVVHNSLQHQESMSVIINQIPSNM